MTSLHYTIEITKKIIIGFAIGIASIIFFILAFRLLVTLKDRFFPTPAAPPTVSFGKLPAIPFPNNSNANNYTYTLNTISGLLPSFPDRATIYKLEQPQPSLLNFDTVQKIASGNNFKSTPTQLSDTLYSWQQTDGLAQKLLFDTITFNFSVTTPGSYLTDANVLAANHVLPQADAINFASSFFDNFSSTPDDLDSAKTKATYYTIQNGTLIPAKSFSTSQVIFVDFYQEDINQLPIVYPHFPTSFMHAVIVSGADRPIVWEASYAHKTILTDTLATYPIKTASQAFDELKKQKAYIANYDGTDTNINIRNVFLAYYLGDGPQLYVYPVIVFSGDNNFYAFVPAVTGEWTGN